MGDMIQRATRRVLRRTVAVPGGVGDRHLHLRPDPASAPQCATDGAAGVEAESEGELLLLCAATVRRTRLKRKAREATG